LPRPKAKAGDVAGKMTAMAGEVGHKANAQWDKLETIFEERTARAMGKLGVPNARALAALVDRVTALEKALGIAPAEAAAAPKGRPKFRAGKALKDAVQVAAPAEPAEPAVKPKPARKAARKAAAPAPEAAAPVKAAIRRRRAAA
jgi:hypothetical protein